MFFLIFFFFSFFPKPRFSSLSKSKLNMKSLNGIRGSKWTQKAPIFLFYEGITFQIFRCVYLFIFFRFLFLRSSTTVKPIDLKDWIFIVDCDFIGEWMWVLYMLGLPTWEYKDIKGVLWSIAKWSKDDVGLRRGAWRFMVSLCVKQG